MRNRSKLQPPQLPPPNSRNGNGPPMPPLNGMSQNNQHGLPDETHPIGAPPMRPPPNLDIGRLQ